MFQLLGVGMCFIRKGGVAERRICGCPPPATAFLCKVLVFEEEKERDRYEEEYGVVEAN